MPKLLIYPRTELPPELNWQIISYIRATAPDALNGFDWWKYWMSEDGNDHSHHMILAENGIMISHTEVVWKTLKHSGETYKVYGLTSVFTYPGLRHQGYGTQIVEAGTKHIRESDADIGLFNCQLQLESFYSRCGWIPMRNVTVLIQHQDKWIAVDELTMMLFLSEKGKRRQATFESEPMRFGEREW